MYIHHTWDQSTSSLSTRDSKFEGWLKEWADGWGLSSRAQLVVCVWVRGGWMGGFKEWVDGWIGGWGVGEGEGKGGAKVYEACEVKKKGGGNYESFTSPDFFWIFFCYEVIVKQKKEKTLHLSLLLTCSDVSYLAPCTSDAHFL